MAFTENRGTWEKPSTGMSRATMAKGMPAHRQKFFSTCQSVAAARMARMAIRLQGCRGSSFQNWKSNSGLKDKRVLYPHR